MLLLEKALGFLAPEECLVCGDEGSLLCNMCQFEAIPLMPELCYRCHKLSADSRVCDKCRRNSPLRHVWVRANYEGLAKDLIHKLKYERAKFAADIVARQMREILPYLPSDTIITHIPAATSRVRTRGYDQAELLAKKLVRYSEMPHSTLLARIGQTRQVGANRTKRLSQLKDAFRVVRPYLVKGANIIIVDDVVTTGASLEEAARQLKAAGAKSVSALAFCHKQ